MNATNKLSVFYDARTIAPGMGGVGRYALNLLRALAQLTQPPAIRALFRPECIELARRDPALAGVELLASPVSHESHPVGDFWLRWRLPRSVRPDEIYHGPAFLIPGGKSTGRRPFKRVVTIHDLFVFTHREFYPAAFRTWLRWRIRVACDCAEIIIVPTQAVADELVARKLAPSMKLRVIAEAPDSSGAPWEEDLSSAVESPNEAASLSPAPTFISIGTLDPRKDPRTAREALIALNAPAKPSPNAARWIWYGGAGSVADDSPLATAQQAAALGFETPGATTGAKLRAELKSATAYVTCSRTEGFGLPLVEAMAAGCPIVASDIAVHREVAGDAALYFTPGDSADLARCLERLVVTPDLRRALITAGNARSGQFSWARAALETLRAYADAAISPPTR